MTLDDAPDPLAPPDRGSGEPAGRPRRTLPVLIVGMLACYAVGYPLALIGGYGAGWILVTLGGVLLLAIGADVVRRVARSERQQRTP